MRVPGDFFVFAMPVKAYPYSLKFKDNRLIKQNVASCVPRCDIGDEICSSPPQTTTLLSEKSQVQIKTNHIFSKVFPGRFDGFLKNKRPLPD